MNDTPWAVTHKKILRGTILLLFIISLLGPWMFDRVFVPAEFTCSPPNIRLEGDFCGVPLSGYQFYRYIVSGMFLELIYGTFVNRSREPLLLLASLSVLPLIPFLISLLSFFKKETRRLRTFSLVAWILALIPALTLFIFQIKHQPIRLWGLWLYMLLVISAIILEIFVIKYNPLDEYK